jgi:hypothetical protein
LIVVGFQALNCDTGRVLVRPSDPRPERKAAAALVVRTVDAIDTSSREDRDALLSTLLYAAWGSPQARKQ